MKYIAMALIFMLAACSIHVRPVPNVSVHIPVPAPLDVEHQGSE
ncbi:hypothetical protein [Mariprofundus ferrinatatus]|nr:hypothetical protein [Mariprofundus ferrinatatus]